MTTALIADDEPLLRDALQRALQHAWPELQVLASVADGQTALHQALALQPRVCFLDVRMPTLSGLEVAAALAEEWPTGDFSTQGPGAAPFPLLVFVTAFDHYAVAAFDAQAADYLLKPIEPLRLARCVQRLQARLAANACAKTSQSTPDDALVLMAQQLEALRHAVSAQSAAARALSANHLAPNPREAPAPLSLLQAGLGQTLHMVPVADVLAIEAADRYLRIFTASAEHLLRMPLLQLRPQLPEGEFWQIHRSMLVRAQAIERVVRADNGKLQLTLKGRTEQYAISRLYAAQFKAM